MWVLKLSGRLAEDPRLPAWLDLVVQLGGGRVAVVPGRGPFGDAARRLDTQRGADPAARHNLQMLAMAQQAYWLQAQEPALQIASSEGEIRHVLRRGRAAVWRPFDLLRDHADAHSTAASSDLLALRLASRLNAERLLIVKAVPVDRQAGPEAWVAQGLLEAEFAQRAREASCPIELLGGDELPRARALLLGDLRASA